MSLSALCSRMKSSLFALPLQVLSAMNFIRSCLFTSDGSRRKKLPPHSRNPFPPEAACFPCSAALPRFAAAGSPQPGSLRFRAFAPQCPGRRSLPPAPTRTAFRTVPSVPRWLALLLFPAPALLTAPCSSCRISLLMAYSSPSWF